MSKKKHVKLRGPELRMQTGGKTNAEVIAKAAVLREELLRGAGVLGEFDRTFAGPPGLIPPAEAGPVINRLLADPALSREDVKREVAERVLPRLEAEAREWDRKAMHETVQRVSVHALAWIDAQGDDALKSFPPVLEANDCTRLHKLRDAMATERVVDFDAVRKLAQIVIADDPECDVISKAKSFVVAHNWHAAFGKASGDDFNGGEWRLPYDHCAFEFRVSGHSIIIIAADGDSAHLLVNRTEHTPLTVEGSETFGIAFVQA